MRKRVFTQSMTGFAFCQRVARAFHGSSKLSKLVIGISGGGLVTFFVASPFNAPPASTSSFFNRASRNLHSYAACSKLLALVTVSGGGGYVAYSDSQADVGSLKADVVQKQGKKKRIVVLGTGWAGTSFLKYLDISSYDVQVVSPRNYFVFTPLLPSVTCGTVEARSIVEPVRNMIKKKNGEIQFLEAECLKIDTANKKVFCRSNINNLVGKNDFSLEYDYLVIGVGAQVNTFNTPGVLENCHFLKEVEDAQKIRRTIIDCFERASLPSLSKEEKEMILHFVVVGGGPTGVEFAAEIHDFATEDIAKLYPSVKDLVQITLLEAGDHILNMFDNRITEFAEAKFRRDGIHLKTGSMVVKVTGEGISTKERATGEVSSISYGMALWSTGIGSRPVIMDFMKQVGQGNRRVLATDEWLRVKGCNDVYALGDCSTIDQRTILEDVLAIFRKCDKNGSGKLNLKELQEIIGDITERYPQVATYLRKNKMKSMIDMLEKYTEIDISKFKKSLSEVDSQIKYLPAIARVAAQQGKYLAECFNHMEKCKTYPEGPLRIRGEGRHCFHPFRYKNRILAAPLGGGEVAVEVLGKWVSVGHNLQWLLGSVYTSMQVSWRTKVFVGLDSISRYIFGRDSSRI